MLGLLTTTNNADTFHLHAQQKKGISITWLRFYVVQYIFTLLHARLP